MQKTKLISDCNKLLKDLLDSLLLESSENKRQFIRACISGLQTHGEERKGRTSLVREGILANSYYVSTLFEVVSLVSAYILRLALRQMLVFRLTILLRNIIGSF